MRFSLFVVFISALVAVDAAPPKPCVIANIPFTPEAGSPLVYLTGSYFRAGSYYAVCNNGVPTCFMDDGTADKPDAPLAIPCTDPKLVAAVKAAPPRRTNARELGLFVRGRDERWPQGIVCYDFNPQLNQNKRTWILDAMKTYKHLGITFMDSQTCVKTYRMQPGVTVPVNTPVCGNCAAVVDIRDDGEGCWAHVGYDPAFPRVLNVGPGCDHPHIYIHELGHVLGLHHEHSHPQREVVILREALPQYPPNDPRFAKQAHQYKMLSFLSETPYDINSIMHYDGPAFCLPKGNVRAFCDIDQPAGYLGCTVPTRAHCLETTRVIGRAPTLTRKDEANIRALYGH